MQQSYTYVALRLNWLAYLIFIFTLSSVSVFTAASTFFSLLNLVKQLQESHVVEHTLVPASECSFLKSYHHFYICYHDFLPTSTYCSLVKPLLRSTTPSPGKYIEPSGWMSSPILHKWIEAVNWIWDQRLIPRLPLVAGSPAIRHCCKYEL